MIGLKEDLVFLRLAQFTGFFAFLKLIFDIEFKVLIRNTTFKILLICFISTIIVGVVNSRLYLFNLVYPLCFFSISWLIVESRLTPIFFIIGTLLVVSFLSFLFITNVPPSEWVKGSRNYVSVILLYLTITSSCVARQNSKDPNLLVYLLLPLISMILSILALGRSGIITSIILFIVNVLFYMGYTNKKARIIPFVLLILFSMVYLISKRYDTIQSNYLYKFEKKGLI